MAHQNPSSVLADSLADFSQAANKAFSEIEAQCKLQLARAASQVQEANTARDEAIEMRHASQVEKHALQQELLVCQTALQRAELMVLHQTEAVAHLRQEAAQWKDQCKNFQGHFLRAEQERCALANKLEQVERYIPLINQVNQRSTTIHHQPATLSYKNALAPSQQKPTTPPNANDSPSEHSKSPPLRNPLIKSRRSISPSASRTAATISTSDATSSSRKRPRTSNTPQPYSLDDESDSDPLLLTSRSPRKPKAFVRSTPHTPQPGPRLASNQRLIRRVEATFEIKHESGDENDTQVILSRMTQNGRAKAHAYTPIRSMDTNLSLELSPFSKLANLASAVNYEERAEEEGSACESETSHEVVEMAGNGSLGGVDWSQLSQKLARATGTDVKSATSGATKKTATRKSTIATTNQNTKGGTTTTSTIAKSKALKVTKTLAEMPKEATSTRKAKAGRTPRTTQASRLKDDEVDSDEVEVDEAKDEDDTDATKVNASKSQNQFRKQIAKDDKDSDEDEEEDGGDKGEDEDEGYVAHTKLTISTTKSTANRNGRSRKNSQAEVRAKKPGRPRGSTVATTNYTVSNKKQTTNVSALPQPGWSITPTPLPKIAKAQKATTAASAAKTTASANAKAKVKEAAKPLKTMTNVRNRNVSSSLTNNTDCSAPETGPLYIDDGATAGAHRGDEENNDMDIDILGLNKSYTKTKQRQQRKQQSAEFSEDELLLSGKITVRENRPQPTTKRNPVSTVSKHATATAKYTKPKQHLRATSTSSTSSSVSIYTPTPTSRNTAASSLAKLVATGKLGAKVQVSSGTGIKRRQQDSEPTANEMSSPAKRRKVA